MQQKKVKAEQIFDYVVEFNNNQNNHDIQDTKY